MTVRKHIRLEERSAALLEQTGSISSYLSEVIGQRWRAAQQALAWLRDEGWSHAQLRQAMDALSTSWEQGLGGCDAAAPRAVLRLSMVSVEGEALDDRVCRALCLLASEWWAGNEALRLQLQEPPVPKATRRAQATVGA